MKRWRRPVPSTVTLSPVSAEDKLRYLHGRFDSVDIYRRTDGLWGIEARKTLPGDSRHYAPYARGLTVAEAIDRLWKGVR